MIFEMRQPATGITPNLGNRNRKIDWTMVRFSSVLWIFSVHRTEPANTTHYGRGERVSWIVHESNSETSAVQTGSNKLKPSHRHLARGGSNVFKLVQTSVQMVQWCAKRMDHGSFSGSFQEFTAV